MAKPEQISGGFFGAPPRKYLFDNIVMLCYCTTLYSAHCYDIIAGFVNRNKVVIISESFDLICNISIYVINEISVMSPNSYFKLPVILINKK